MVLLRTLRVLSRTLRVLSRTLRMTLKTLRAAKVTPRVRKYGTEEVVVIQIPRGWCSGHEQPSGV
jgi:hypothetical protein